MIRALQPILRLWRPDAPARLIHLRRFAAYFLLLAALLGHGLHYGFTGDEAGYVAPNTAELADHPFVPFVFKIDTGHPMVYIYPVALLWRWLGICNAAANVATWIYTALALAALHSLARRMLARAPEKRAPAWMGAAAALALCSTPLFISLAAQYLDPMPYLALLLMMVLAWAGGRRVALGLLATLLALVRITGCFSVLGLGLFDLGHQWFVLRRRSWRGAARALVPYAAAGCVLSVYLAYKLFILHRPMSTIAGNKPQFAGWVLIQNNLECTLRHILQIPRYGFKIMLAIAVAAVLVTLARRGWRRMHEGRAAAGGVHKEQASRPPQPGPAALYGALGAAMLAPTLFYIIDFVYFIQPRYLLFWHAFLIIAGVHGLLVLLGRRAWLVLPILGLWCGVQVVRWHGQWVDRVFASAKPATRARLRTMSAFSLDMQDSKVLTHKAVDWLRRKCAQPTTLCTYPSIVAFGDQTTGYGPPHGTTLSVDWVRHNDPKAHLASIIRKTHDVYFVRGSWDIRNEIVTEDELMADYDFRKVFHKRARSGEWIQIFKYQGPHPKKASKKDKVGK